MSLLTIIAPGHMNENNEVEFKETALFYLSAIPNLHRYILVNNSKHVAQFDVDDERFIYINDRSAFSKIPSVGEANLIDNILESSNDELFMKVHARCPIVNINHFIQAIDLGKLSDFYCILRKNLIADLFGKYPSRCYVDTRILIFKGSFGKALFKWVKGRYNSNLSNGMIEHEVFNYLCLQEFDNVTFFSSLPKMVGTSGHGRNYNSLRSRMRHLLAQMMFKLGLS